MQVHFLIPPEFANALEDLQKRVVGRDYPYWVVGELNWVVQSWLILRDYRDGMSIGAEPRPNVVNFSHSLVWRARGARLGEFRLGVRADFPRLFDVDFEILQNPAVRLSSRQAYLPYWPVPGIVPRDSDRTGLKTIAYAGFLGQRNLASQLCDGGHRAFGGLNFVVVPPEQWHDMSQIDLLVAIRSFDKQEHPTKPPSKLINAWIGGIPLVAGWDSAYSATGTPMTDYIRISTESEFKEQVDRLRTDPIYYDRFVEAGRKRAPEFSRERIANAWLAILDGPVQQTYLQWLDGRGSWRQRGARYLDTARNAASHRKRKLKSIWSSS
jgi:hypothetical protein